MDSAFVPIEVTYMARDAIPMASTTTCQRNVRKNVWALRPRLGDSVSDDTFVQPCTEGPVIAHHSSKHVMIALVVLDDRAAPRMLQDSAVASTDLPQISDALAHITARLLVSTGRGVFQKMCVCRLLLSRDIEN